MTLTKFFESAKIEKFWIEEWEKRGYFTASTKLENVSFSLYLPPPNVTGTLHMGHAFNQTIADTLIRYYRMRGFNTVGIPGTDHAGIATQIMVERELDTQQISRHTLGRTKFIEKAEKWKEKFGSIITNQMRRIGVSVDWDRQYFTMDAQMSKVVIEVFVRLYEEGLIYRGKRLVNWDPVLGTAISDLEVISNEENGLIWYINYPLGDSSNDYITVATTRPETLFGDVAVAVHPNDERYINLIGKMLKLPLTNREIPIIQDNYVDPAFCTGCVKITPAHDFNDYIVGQRHDLDIINIFTLDAKININGPIKYQGLDRFDARKQIISDLDKLGLLNKIIPYKLIVSRGDRTGVIIEPMLTDQWFLAMNKPTIQSKKFTSYFPGKSLAQVALEKVLNGEIKLIPENWNNIYQQWLHNIQDWCISRQLWWGHQIPAWYDTDGKIYVARSEEEAKKQAGNKNITRDNDVLDTWFSSALIPFSTLGWPDTKLDYELFLPSSVLVTGFDIIFFWMVRMIMMTTHFTGKIPFKIVYIHGLIRDSNGQKMSKSKGNTLDPIDLIDGINVESLVAKRIISLMNSKQAIDIAKKTHQEFSHGIPAFGTDALRLTFISLATLGRDINFDLQRCEGYRNFCNKLWNAARFVLINTENKDCGFSIINNEKQNLQFSKADRWIISLLHRTEAKIENSFINYRLDQVAAIIYKFAWDEYCCWYLEIAKIQFKIGDLIQQRTTRYTLLRVLERLLRLAHPILPFITETLWQTIAPLTDVAIDLTCDSIMRQLYPVSTQEKRDIHAETWVIKLKKMIDACRNLRGTMQLSSTLKIPLLIETKNQASIESFLPYLKIFVKLSEIQIIQKLPILLAPVIIIDDIKFMLRVDVDISVEKERLIKEMTHIRVEISKVNAKLTDTDFITRAPTSIVIREKKRLTDFNATFLNLQEQLLKL